jgi:hypothetical protein
LTVQQRQQRQGLLVELQLWAAHLSLDVQQHWIKVTVHVTWFPVLALASCCRANAVRVLGQIVDSQLLAQIERYLKQAVVDKSPVVAASVLISALHLIQKVSGGLRGVFTKPLLERCDDQQQQSAACLQAASQHHPPRRQSQPQQQH